MSDGDRLLGLRRVLLSAFPIAGFLIGVFFLTRPVFANIDSGFDTLFLDNWGEPEPFKFEPSKSWDLGVSPGYAFAAGRKKITQVVRNDLFEEFPVQGPNRYSTITGDLRDGYAIDIQAYRRIDDWFSIGFEGGYQRHAIRIPLPEGISGGGTAIPEVEWNRNIFQAGPAVKWGPTMGRFHPYVVAGCGWAFIEEKVLLEYDQFPGTSGTADVRISGYYRDHFASVHGGAGFEFGVPNDMSIGLDAVYNKIFAPPSIGALSYFIPRMRIDYHF